MNPDKLLEGQVSNEEEEEEEDYVPGDSDEDDDDDLEYEYDSEYETESSTDSEEGLNVTVRTVMGQEFNFVVSPDSTVIDLKMAIFVNLNRMHPDTQVLKILMQMVGIFIRDRADGADHRNYFADTNSSVEGADLPWRGDGGGRGDHGRLRHPGGQA